MSRNRGILLPIAVAMAIVGFGIFCNTGAQPTPQTAEADRARRETVVWFQKKLPEVISHWITEQHSLEKDVSLVKNVKLETQVMRWLGPTDIKITLRCTFKEDLWKDDNENQQYSFILTFYLRYYDGKWTTTQGSSSEPKINMPQLMLVIDQAIAK